MTWVFVSRFCTERCSSRLRLLVVLGDWGGDGQLSILPASLDPHSRPTHPSWTHPHPQNLQILAETFFHLDKMSLMDFNSSIQTDLELSGQLQDLTDSFQISGQLSNCRKRHAHCEFCRERYFCILIMSLRKPTLLVPAQKGNNGLFHTVLFIVSKYFKI